MKNISVVLRKEEKEERFVSPEYVPGSLFRRAADVAELIESQSLSSDDLDVLISFVCDVFDNKFTIDEFEDGTDARRMMDTIYGVVNFVLGNITAASKLLGGSEGENNSDEGK
ncbi:phage tail assembly chaperone G [Cytobacillus purgationiresistens]|uniref:Phage protein n=1 Tax=Cytobacillus purgationiresistens TaxID=863449 RepID=A0ABU0AC95_9BACI|nr:hypothetical protein [Cytobacillus purgationiresistens]MDQ0268873.1 hypothetical protein [Cytobacillus purgationiresistens]